MVQCMNCRAEFELTSGHLKRYCSLKCRHQAINKRRNAKKNRGIYQKTNLPSPKIIGAREYEKLWRHSRKEIHNKKQRERYANDPVYHQYAREHQRKLSYERRQKLRQELYTLFDNKCQICGEIAQCCFVIHHINEELKPMRGNSSLNWPIIAKLKNHFAQLNNIMLLCENCHRKLHSGVIHL